MAVNMKITEDHYLYNHPWGNKHWREGWVDRGAGLDAAEHSC
jgi:hypothetical protein